VERVGPARALDICATGRVVDATEAVSTGIANRLADSGALPENATALAQELCRAPAAALRELKPLIHGARGRSVADQLAAEREAQIRRILELTGIATDGTG
jgi:enoyl-CoA hydratase/carnithine racemase